MSLLDIDEKITLVSGGVENFGLMQRVLADYEIDTLFHLAATALVGKVMLSPLSTFQTNIMGTANILEACRVVGNVEIIIVASSDKSYGHSNKLPYVESMPLNA